VFLASLLVGVGLSIRVLAAADFEISTFLAFGEDSTAITEHAEDLLGRQIEVRKSQGHDGKFFFLQALDPLYLNPNEHSVLLDRPVYRGQRMLYPLIAGLGGLMPVQAVPWSMVLLNILALGWGGLGTARLAVRYGASPWWGLAFPLNLGMLGEFVISGGGVVAFAAAIWGVLALEEDRPGLAAAWLTASVLAREAMLLFVAGVAFEHWRRTRRKPIRLVIAPLGAALAWAAYLRLRLGGGSGVDEVQEIGVPFMGIVGAVPFWLDRRFDLLVGLLIIGLLLVFGLRVLRSDSYLGWGSAGFIVLAVVLTRQVWTASFDITRAVAPVLTAFIIVTFAGEPAVPEVSARSD